MVFPSSSAAIRFYDLEPSFSKVYYSTTVPVSGFLCEEFSEIHFHSFSFFFQNFFHAKNGLWIETDGNLNAQDQGCMLGVVAVQFLPISEFLSWLFVQYWVSHCSAAG